MSWNGSGTFTRTLGSAAWVGDAAAGTKIVANRHDTNDTDLATGINNCVAKDGQNAFTGTTGGTALRGAVDNTSDLGSTLLRWRNLYAGTSIIFQGASFATTVTAAPTANRSVVLADVAGTLGPTQYLGSNVATTSGTTVVITPTGLSSIAYSRFAIMFEGASLSGTNDVLIQLADSGGYINSGYISRCMTINNTTMASQSFTAGFGLSMANATGTLYGCIYLQREATTALPGGDTWHVNGSLVNGIGTNGQLIVAGICPLGSSNPARKVDSIRLSVSGANTFDAGAVWVVGYI